MAAEPGGSEEEKYRRFVSQAKEEARNGNLEESISLFRKALEIRPSEKLTKNIKKLEEALASLALDGEEDGFVDVCQSGLMLYGEMHENLFEHQREGVAFLYSLYRDGRKGGILADDMGLGKTIQIIAFLSGMFDAEHIRYVLLVMPTTLVSNWIKEFDKWTPGLRVKVFHGKSVAERSHHLERIQRKNGVLITTYQMLLNNWQQLSSFGEKRFVWDYVILDEAHKIKTPSAKTTKCLHAIPSKHRVLLTGTPVQNNLKELWALFDFACQGSLLGTMKTFKMEYEDPITAARAKNATLGEKALGLKISENLMSLIKPYFLRRSKEELQKKAKSEPKCSLPGAPGKDAFLAMPSLPRKNDFIVWVYLAPIQEDIYRKFVSLDHIQELLMTTRSPLAQLSILKKLCDHPRLLPAQACSQLGLEMSSYNEMNGGEHAFSCPNVERIPDEILIEESGKLGFLLALLERLQEEGHRTLVFSQSRKMLDIIERILTQRNFQLLRIDGTVSHLMEREKRIGMFQKDKDYSVFLLTTQVGGVGITLTAATRVVIFDPSWNPAVDAQAVDRVYRIGQEENVVVYRLITCGTVEEKIYRRQVFKDSLIRQSTGDKKNPYRYFTTQELRELFTLEDFRCSTTQTQLQSLHANQRKTDVALDEHIAYLHSLEIFGISDHDLMYVHETVEDDEPENEEAHRYIEGRIQKAQELVRLESQLKKQEMERIKNMSEAAWLRETESFTQPKKKPPKPSLNHTLRPPVPAEPQSNNERIVLVSDDDQNDDRNVINVSSRMTSPIKDQDEEEITRDISYMEVSLQSQEEAKGADMYQCKEDHNASLVSSISEGRSCSNKESCSPEPKATSDAPAVSGSTINGIQVPSHQSLERSEVSDPDLMFTPETLQANDPENEETQRYIEDGIQMAQERIQLESQLKEQLKENIKNMTEETCLVEMESFTLPMKMPLKSPDREFMVPMTAETNNNEPVIILSDDDDVSDDKHIINLSSKMASLLKDLDEEEVTQETSNMEVSLQSKEEAKGTDMYQCKEDHNASLVSPVSEGRSCSNKERCSLEPRATSDVPLVSGSTINGTQMAYHQSLGSSEVSDPDLMFTPDPENEETQRYIKDGIQTTQEQIQLESQLKEQQKESIKNMTQETCLVEMDSFTLPMKMPLNCGFVPPIPDETKRDNGPVTLFSDDDECDDDKYIINRSSKMTGPVLEELDGEELTQDISSMEVSLQKKEAEVTSVSQHKQSQDSSLVSPISKTCSFSNKETSRAESKALSHDMHAVAINTSNDLKMASLRLSSDMSFSKPKSKQKSPVFSHSQVYSLSNMENCNPESEIIPLFPAANTSCIFNDVQKAPQRLEYTSNDAKQKTKPEVSFGTPTVPPGHLGEAVVIDSAPAFQLQANKMSNFSAEQEGGISDVMMENEFVDSAVVYGHFSLALEELEDSLQSEALTGDTVNSGFQLKLDSYCSSEDQSWLGATRDNKSFQANKSITGSMTVDGSDPTCDPSKDDSDVVSGHKKKLVRRIASDSEEEEEEGHLVEADHQKVFMSTPKSSRPMAGLYFSPQLRIRGRRSTASRRSLVDTVLDRMEDIAAAMEMSNNMTHERSFHSSPERDVNEDSGHEWESSNEMVNLDS